MTTKKMRPQACIAFALHAMTAMNAMAVVYGMDVLRPSCVLLLHHRRLTWSWLRRCYMSE